jgi:hypothetical protein
MRFDAVVPILSDDLASRDPLELLTLENLSKI